MKKNLNGQKIFYFFIFLSYIAMNLLFVSVIVARKEKDEIYAGYKSEKLLFQIFFDMRNESFEKVLGNYKEVKAFGIYDFTGELVMQYGKVPPIMTEEDFDFRPGRGEFDIKNGVIRIIRPMVDPGMMYKRQMMGDNGTSCPPMGRAAHPKGIIYTEINIDDLNGKNIGYTIALFLVPVILFIFTVLILHLYRKNEEFKKQIDKNSELLRLGEVSRTLTHEIKNPLAAINIHTGILKKILPVEYKSEISLIEDEVARLKVISERIGDFLRDPAGFPELVDVSMFINEMILRFNHTIIFENTGEQFFVSIDKQRLRSVLENIIRNSIESLEESGGNTPIAINVSAETGRYGQGGNDIQKKIVIRVIDQGKGFDGDAERLFDPYYTTKTKGSGIGLAIARRFIEGAHGVITIRNRNGGGAVVTISLPEVFL